MRRGHHSDRSGGFWIVPFRPSFLDCSLCQEMTQSEECQHLEQEEPHAEQRAGYHRSLTKTQPPVRLLQAIAIAGETHLAGQVQFSFERCGGRSEEHTSELQS